MNPLVARALEIAVSQIGVRERGRNRGPEVDAYLLAAGLDPTRGSYPWCAAFVTWAFRRAAAEMDLVCPLPRTASVSKLWMKSPVWMRSELPVRGGIFCIDKGKGKGHAGLVLDIRWPEQRILTVEGNTNDGGSREGDGVYKLSRRRDEVTYGFINVGAKPPERVA